MPFFEVTAVFLGLSQIHPKGKDYIIYYWEDQ